MAPSIPCNDLPALEWLEGRIASWSANCSNIGLTSAQVTELAQRVAKTRGAFTGVETIRTASNDATRNFHEIAQDMRANAGILISAIKNFARQSGDPQSVFDTAGVLPADPRSPVAPPQQPTNINCITKPDGCVTLGWDARSPEGVTYLITRRLNGTGNYAFIGQAHCRDKNFTDTTIPQGIITASYIVQGVRSGQTGPQSNPVVVQFDVPDQTPACSLAA